MHNNSKKIIIDDWGLSPEINQSCIDIAKKKKLFAVSMLSTMPYFNYKLDEILKFKIIKIGLHLNISQLNFDIDMPIHKKLLFYRAIFSKKQLLRAIKKQYKTLLQATKRIDYIDGHHHLHLLPNIQKTVFDFAIRKKCKLRIINDKDHLPSLFLAKLSALEKSDKNVFFAKYCCERNFRNFDEFQKKLDLIDDPILLHTAIDSKESRNQDPIFTKRVRQYNFLMKYFQQNG